MKPKVDKYFLINEIRKMKSEKLLFLSKKKEMFLKRAIITRSWFETARKYKPRILGPQIEEFTFLVHKFSVIKFGFSEKATKFEKNLRRTFDKSVVFCARNSVLVKKSTKIFKKNVDKSYYTNFIKAIWIFLGRV